MTGQTITHYEVLEKLGGGGMGVVYRARDVHLNRFVALKFLAPELTRDDSAKQRFIQEAQAASALDHSNICTIHEIGKERQIDNLPPSSPTALPVWSPDGQWLALSVTRGEVQRLWRTHVDGSSAEPVTTGPGGDPIWSPDSRQIFFPGVQERTGNVWAISLADRHERPVTALTGRLGHLMTSALATDGHRLFFSWEENIGDIWVMDVTSSGRE